MELPPKIMLQHFNSMLEHLKVPSLIKKNNTKSSAKTSPTTAGPGDQVDKSAGRIANHSKVTELVNHFGNNNGKATSGYQNHTSDNADQRLPANNNNVPIVVKASEAISKSADNSPMPARQHNSLPVSGLLDVGSGAPVVVGQRKLSSVMKPIKLRNITSEAETYDTLHTKGVEVS